MAVVAKGCKSGAVTARVSRISERLPIPISMISAVKERTFPTQYCRRETRLPVLDVLKLGAVDGNPKEIHSKKWDRSECARIPCEIKADQLKLGRGSTNPVGTHRTIFRGAWSPTGWSYCSWHYTKFPCCEIGQCILQPG